MLKSVKALLKLQTKLKAKHSAVAIKKVVKTVEGLGFTVTGIKAAPDGSFFVETAKGSGSAADPNPWDEVLPK
jgi:hypothetical protein